MATERSFTRSARINAPPQAVWDFMMDLESAPKWIKGVVSSKQVSPGPMQAGAVIRETRTIGKRTETYDIHVKRFDPPARYVAAAHAGKAEFEYGFELRDAGGATEVTMRATARGKGLFTRMFIGVGMRFMEKVDGDQLERLKKAVEGRA
ncbi:MAG TPA: SRPBCC family protein [Candidatus Thermoplasmatota archaeon]